MERSMSIAEDEASSSSWMQMVVEAKMLEVALQAIEELRQSAESEEEKLVAEKVSSSSSSTLLGSPPKSLEDPGPSKNLAHLMKGKESIRVDEEEEEHSSSSMELKRMILGERARWMRPSIYRVPHWLKSMTKAEAYRPQVVSLGPFHHGELCLQPMEEHKRRLTLHMVERSKKPLVKFMDAIWEVADKLQDAYDNLGREWCAENKGRFVDVMVTDGGILLEFMTTVTRTGLLGAGYAPYDPIFSERSLLSLWARIRSDMILVENQVPLLALQTLEAVRSGTVPGNADINELVTDFLCPKLSEGISRDGTVEESLGLHPLERFHRRFCGLSKSVKSRKEGQQEETMLSAVELREAGVHFTRSNTRNVQDIGFSNGVLSMPLVEIGDASERKFFNLMAFERLHSNAGSVATDYMIFMDNIIDSERDVALLRSKGVLRNFLSSDKAATDLFNTVGKGATLNPRGNVGHVQWKVANHCSRPWPKLQASFKHTYLRNPWVFISGVAAITLLALTILQTVYTVMPFYTKD